jgi:hypothetical protein
MRGISDSVIIERLKIEDLLFLTNDREFLQRPPTGLCDHRLSGKSESAYRNADRNLA